MQEQRGYSAASATAWLSRALEQAEVKKAHQNQRTNGAQQAQQGQHSVLNGSAPAAAAMNGSSYGAGSSGSTANGSDGSGGSSSSEGAAGASGAAAAGAGGARQAAAMQTPLEAAKALALEKLETYILVQWKWFEWYCNEGARQVSSS